MKTNPSQWAKKPLQRVAAKAGSDRGGPRSQVSAQGLITMPRLALSTPELDEIEALATSLQGKARVRCEGMVDFTHRKMQRQLPLYSFSLGSTNPKDPCLLLVGGVHGLEVIGTQVVLSYLNSLCHQLEWDSHLRESLARIRLIFYPCANPGGLLLGTRANPSGVDLMRNAPIDSTEVHPWFLLGGHRLSHHLPWYRGKAAQPEAESQILFELVRRELWPSRFSISLDLHSGFGSIDRLWFPFAYSRRVFDNVIEMAALRQLLDETYPYHIYRIEPQATQYCTHGDLWDYLYLEHRELNQHTFLPLCLEMGSWNWVRKNPKQLFSMHGIFNPMTRHRQHRILRRHLLLLDFLTRSVAAHGFWLPQAQASRRTLQDLALRNWYRSTA